MIDPFRVTLQSIQPTVQELHKYGIGSILDYAAEDDVNSDRGVAGAASLSEQNYATIVRTYEYESEKKCDSHVQIFMRALEAAKTLPGQGFAAIKVRKSVMTVVTLLYGSTLHLDH